MRASGGPRWRPVPAAGWVRKPVEAVHSTKRFTPFTVPRRALPVVPRSCFVLRPPEGAEPRCLLHFIGGSFVGAAPQLAYRPLLEALAARGALVRRAAPRCACLGIQGLTVLPLLLRWWVLAAGGQTDLHPAMLQAAPGRVLARVPAPAAVRRPASHAAAPFQTSLRWWLCLTPPALTTCAWRTRCGPPVECLPATCPQHGRLPCRCGRCCRRSLLVLVRRFPAAEAPCCSLLAAPAQAPPARVPRPQVHFKFERCLKALGPAAIRLQRYGLGHSLGALLHALIGSRYPIASAGNVLMSYNNRPATGEAGACGWRFELGLLLGTAGEPAAPPRAHLLWRLGLRSRGGPAAAAAAALPARGSPPSHTACALCPPRARPTDTHHQLASPLPRAPPADSIPLLSPLIAPNLRALGPILSQLATSPLRSGVEQWVDLLKGEPPAAVSEVKTAEGLRALRVGCWWGAWSSGWTCSEVGDGGLASVGPASSVCAWVAVLGLHD